MTDIEIYTSIPASIFDENGNAPETMILVRGSSVSILPSAYKTREDDRVFRYSKQDGSVSIAEVDKSQFSPEFTSAEDWLTDQGYTGTRLIALLDLEAKLKQENKTSPKMVAVREWINSILSSFVFDPTPKNDWVPCPYSFEETTQEAFLVLTANP